MSDQDTTRSAIRDGRPSPGGERTVRRARGGQGGFALVIVLLALVGLTAMAVGGWFLADSSYKASRAQRTSMQALYVANAGLEQFLAEHQGPAPTSPVTYSYPDGTAEVTLDTMRVLNPLQSVWRIRSVGTHPLPKGGTARRTVQTIAVLNASMFKFPSAFSSATGLQKNGNAGEISGYDHATSMDCPEGGNYDRSGVATPPPPYDYQQSGGGGSIVPDGSPKDTAQYASQSELLDETGLDWSALVAGELLQFDYVVPPDAWPNFSSMPSDEWPVIYIDNAGGQFNLSPSYSGRGVLIVRGDLEISGQTNWDGPILVGGAVTTDGKQIIHGAIASGFNLQLGESVPQSSIGNGNKEILYHSCNLHASMRQTATFVADPGTWAETF